MQAHIILHVSYVLFLPDFKQNRNKTTNFSNVVTIHYVNNTTHINQQLLKVKILAKCFSYSEASSGQKRNIVLVHSVIVPCNSP